MSPACCQRAILEYLVYVESGLGESVVYSEFGKGMAWDVRFVKVAMCVISLVDTPISACACSILKLQICGSLLHCTLNLVIWQFKGLDPTFLCGKSMDFQKCCRIFEMVAQKRKTFFKLQIHYEASFLSSLQESMQNIYNASCKLY